MISDPHFPNVNMGVSMSRFAVFAAFASLTAGACGHRAPSVSPDAAVSSSGQPDAAVARTGQGVDTGLVADAQGSHDSLGTTQHPETCIVATRIDGCCELPAAASIAEVLTDPCLVGAGEAPAQIRPGQCNRPDSCDEVDCSFVPPPSRLTARVGQRCAFVAECDDVDDCVLATNWEAGCCPCPTAYPPVLLEGQRCLVAWGEERPTGCRNCAGWQCEMCLKVEMRCQAGTMSRLKRCVEVLLDP